MSIFRNVVLNLKTEKECERAINLYKEQLSSLTNSGIIDAYICRLSKESILFFATIDTEDNAEKIFEGGYSSTDTNSKTSLSAIHWLEDEDAEMAMATIQAADGNMRLANDRIQKAINFYQRAISELQSITGAIVAPEEQQRSQRRPQGRTS